jgi:group I intron endonuclease
MIIYKTTNLINGKFYVGQDSNNNPEYYGSGTLLKRAIKKQGKQNFIKETLEICSTQEQLNAREKYWIKETKAQELGYNIAEGGTGGNTISEENKDRILNGFRGRKHTPESLKKMRGIKKNPKLSEKEIERRRQKLIEMRNDSEFIKKQEEGFKNCKNMNYSQKFLDMQKSENKRGEKSPMWGKKHTPETRNKMSASNNRYWLGKNQPPEAIEKRRQKMIGRKVSEEVKEKQRVKMTGENNPFYGETHTPEAKEKIRQSKINKTPEQMLETYNKFHISRMGYEPSEEQKQKKLQEYIKKKEK